MPRKGAVRKTLPKKDPIYGNRMVTKLINRSMYDGKKSVAQGQVYKAFELIEKETKRDPVAVFNTALGKIRPEMEVRSRRVGGAAYQVPVPVRGDRKDSLAIRWLISAARAKSNSEFHTFAEKLARELIEASNGEGGAVRKKLEIEKIAESNKAFSHFKW
ncbi:30S ribosomal protein S7 [Candidatus Microgenomates bacterium]|nr:30S ribosomal protein S7 [Candidatus Microgenomates bacterium]